MNVEKYVTDYYVRDCSQESQQNDAPVAVEEKTIPNMAEKTEPETDRTVETEPKKKPKMAKPQKTKTAPKPKKTKTARKPAFKITDYEQFWKSIM